MMPMTLAPIRPLVRLAPALLAGLLAAASAPSCSGWSPSHAATHVPPTLPLKLEAVVDRGAVLAGSDGIVRAEVVLRARPVRKAEVQHPVDLALVVDRSGSMNGTKLERAKAAARELVGGLSARDRLCLVAFASDVETIVPLGAATAEARMEWIRAIDALATTGGTAMSLGLDRVAEELARQPSGGRMRRVILLSDGMANEADATEAGLLGRSRALLKRDAVLTTVGFGMDFNEHLMTAMADAGTGNFYFVEESGALAGVFASEFSATRATVATAVAVTLRPGAGVEVVDAAGYPLERSGDSVVFRPGTMFAGQERRVWITYRVPTGAAGVRSLGSVTASALVDSVPHVAQAITLPTVECVADRPAFVASIDRKAWARSVVAEEYRATQQEVARRVAEGKREEALQALDAYLAAQTALNATIASPEVTANCAEALQLRAQVEDSFTGSGQAEKQKGVAKANWAAGNDGRRVGSKRAAP